MIDAVNDAERKRPKSKELYERALRTAAGGVQDSNSRAPLGGWVPFPIFMARGDGAYLFDVDGNSYIDYLAASGPLVLGHRPKRVLAAVQRTLEETGSLFGFCHELEIEASEACVEAVPSWEMVRFSNTGTEAVMLALRIARAYTGRTKVLTFEGHFHGWSDFTYYKVDSEDMKKAKDSEILTLHPGSAGMNSSLIDVLLLRRWNDVDVLEKTFAEHGSELAAVICEPLLAGPLTPPKPGYLQKLRDLCTKHGVVLIYDEVKTGFRLALGGAQELFGVLPDLSTAAKAMGAGFAVSAVGGRKDLFEPFTLGKIRQGSTYAASPFALSACIATIEELRQPGFYERLNGISNRLVEGLDDAAKKTGVAAYARGVGSMVELVFADRVVDNPRDSARYDDGEKYTPLWEGFLRGGVLIDPGGGGFFVSAAHTEKEIDWTLQLVRAMFAEMAAAPKKSQTRSKRKK